MKGAEVTRETVPTPRPRNRKEQILASAAELFAERGYAAVGVDTIAAQVGVTGPAIYRHYRTKEDLLATLLERTVTGFTDVVARARQGDLDHLIGCVVAHVLDHPAEAASYMRERSQFERPGPPRLVEAEGRFRREWQRALEVDFARLDPSRIAMRQQAVLAGLAAAARDGQDVPRPRLDELLTRSTVAVLLTPPTAALASDVAGGRRRWEPPSGRREEILSAALALFRRKGVSGVGMDEIGAAAGISGPTVYHYYRNKAELVLDAYDRASERVSVGTDDALRNASSAREALEAMVRSYVDIATDNLDLIVVASREGSALPAPERSRLWRRRREVRDKWALALQAARPDLAPAEVRLLVRAVFPTLNGAVTASQQRSDLRSEVAMIGVSYLLCERSFDERKADT